MNRPFLEQANTLIKIYIKCVVSEHIKVHYDHYYPLKFIDILRIVFNLLTDPLDLLKLVYIVEAVTSTG